MAVRAGSRTRYRRITRRRRPAHARPARAQSAGEVRQPRVHRGDARLGADHARREDSLDRPDSAAHHRRHGHADVVDLPGRPVRADQMVGRAETLRTVRGAGRQDDRLPAGPVRATHRGPRSAAGAADHPRHDHDDHVGGRPADHDHHRHVHRPQEQHARLRGRLRARKHAVLAAFADHRVGGGRARATVLRFNATRRIRPRPAPATRSRRRPPRS